MVWTITAFLAPSISNLLQFERRNYRQSGAPAESCRLRCFRYLSAIYRDNDICRYKLRRWSECVLLVAVGLWSDSGPQRSRAARTRGPGLQRPANASSSSSDRECSARQTHDRDTGSIDTRSARGVATSEINTLVSLTSSCRHSRQLRLSGAEVMREATRGEMTRGVNMRRLLHPGVTSRCHKRVTHQSTADRTSGAPAVSRVSLAKPRGLPKP